MNFRGALIAGFAVICGGAASAAIPADVIRNFNDALESGDRVAVVAAADRLVDAALKNPDDEQAVASAFEAGTQLCLRGACSNAIAAEPLLAGAVSEIVSPAHANLLIAYAKWSQSRDKTTDAGMMAALQGAAGAEATLLTLSAFDNYYLYEFGRDNARNIRNVAELAAEHYTPVRDLIPTRWAVMELAAAAGQFRSDREKASIDRFAELEVALYPYYLAGESEFPQIESLYFQTVAWRSALSAYFASIGKFAEELSHAEEYADEERSRIGKQYRSEQPPREPLCTGGFRKAPKPTYPFGASNRGYVGAVILGFDIDNGKLENVRVLAAVPDRQFEKAALDSMQSMEWYFDEQQKDPDCRRSRSGRPGIIPFEFVFQ